MDDAIHIEELHAGEEGIVGLFAKGHHDRDLFLRACLKYLLASKEMILTLGSGTPSFGYHWWRQSQSDDDETRWMLRVGVPGVGKSFEATVIAFDTIQMAPWDDDLDMDF